jgi:hypothetical protein
MSHPHVKSKSIGDNPLYPEGEKPVVRVVRDALIIETHRRGASHITVIPLEKLIKTRVRG